MDLDLVDVLLVEDSSYEAELIILELKKHNIANNIFHVKDGEEALNFIFGIEEFEGKRNVLHPPKLILLDIQMPKVNGIEVLQALKADERTRAIPVVMLTSSKEDPDIKKCYLAGVNSYIVKPVDFKGFADAIQNLGFYWLLLNQRPI
jgi:two-component system response regulator